MVTPLSQWSGAPASRLSRALEYDLCLVGEPTVPDVWVRVSEHRHCLANDFVSRSEAQLDAQSWCDGWRVRDVLGHLVHNAEATRPSVFRDLARYGVWPNSVVRRMAQDLGERPIPELCDRLRAACDGRYHLPGTPPELILGEVFVHRADAFGPLDTANIALREDALRVLPCYWRLGWAAFGSRRYRKVKLRATDGTWTAGGGPDVFGTTTDLLLLMGNRRQILNRLSGPGVSIL